MLYSVLSNGEGLQLNCQRSHQDDPRTVEGSVMDEFRVRTKFDAIKIAEKNGEVADSMEVRKALILRMEAGEITLDEVQKELKKIKRDAKKNGKVTRNQVFRRA